MLRYIFLCFLLPVAFKPSELRAESIRNGNCMNPLVACKDIHVAHSCNSVQPCIQIWEKMKVPRDNNEICDLCKEMVQEARDQLLSNETQEEIKQVFEGSCNLIPIKTIAKECISVVDQLIPTLIESLASRMDPLQVCTVAGLCNNGKLVSIMKAQLPELAPILLRAAAGKSDKCTECKSTMTFVKKIIKNIGLDSFTQLMFDTCKNEFHGKNIECEVIAKDVIPVVYNYLKYMDPNIFCGAMKSCPLKHPLPKPVGDNLTCEFCEALVTYVKNIVSSASTKEEFRTAFTNMCKDLREFSGECSTLVSEYFDQVYDFVVKQLDPQLACSALGLCGDSSRLVNRPKITPQVQIFPANEIRKPLTRVGLRIIESQPEATTENIPGIKIRLPEASRKYNRVGGKEDIETNNIVDEEISQPQQLSPERFLHPSVISQNDLLCTVCKTVITFVDQQLKEKKTEDLIRNALDEVCAYLPGEISNECADFVNEYTDMIVNLLVQEINPDLICGLLNVCPEGTSIKAIPIPMPEQPKGVFCEVCVKVMQYVEEELENNSTEEAVREALDKACSILPKSIAVKCQNFMDEYSEKIFELLSKEVAPRMVCSLIGICPFGEKSKPKPKPNSEIECQICQYALHYIQGRLMDNTTEDEIKQYLKDACQELPQKIAAECTTYVDQYADAILALLAQEIDPSVICVELNICPGGNRPVKMASTTPIRNLNIDTCGTCQIVVDYMDKLLENDDVDREIVKLVEKVCNVVPISVRDQCTTIIDAYGPYILQMIGQLADSKEVCRTIDLCSRVPGHVHMLGGEKCSFGPTYWCQSSAHAAACKADMYCKQKVWGA